MTWLFSDIDSDTGFILILGLGVGIWGFCEFVDWLRDEIDDRRPRPENRNAMGRGFSVELRMPNCDLRMKRKSDVETN
jgi:hypothetical protein